MAEWQTIRYMCMCEKLNLCLCLYTNIMADIIYTLIVLFKNSEECRKNRDRERYKKHYQDMKYIYVNNRETLRELDRLIQHVETTWANFRENMDYMPPALKADDFPVQYRDRIMEPTQIPSASMSSGLLANNSPDLNLSNPLTTVHVPQLPPIQEYYKIGGPLDNSALYQIGRDTHAAMDANRERFERNFRADMNRMNTF